MARLKGLLALTLTLRTLSRQEESSSKYSGLFFMRAKVPFRNYITFELHRPDQKTLQTVFQYQLAVLKTQEALKVGSTEPRRCPLCNWVGELTELKSTE